MSFLDSILNLFRPRAQPQPRLEPQPRFTDAEKFVKWLCKFYMNQPYPRITISQQKIDEINAGRANKGDSFYLAGTATDSPTGEIVLARREIFIDKYALWTLVEVGHHIKNCDDHLDYFPSDDSL